MMQEPWVSATVTLAVPANDLARITPVKGHFTSAGFEVHAPFTGQFSIGGRRSLFEQYFGQRVLVDDSQLMRKVTTEDGGYDLPLEVLPDELRGLVKSICFQPPPDFAGFGG